VQNGSVKSELRTVARTHPTRFIEGLPLVSIIRPSSVANAGAVATIKSFTTDLLLEGQSKEFFAKVMALAEAGDAAKRRV
jgi:hypothetical protein